MISASLRKLALRSEITPNVQLNEQCKTTSKHCSDSATFFKEVGQVSESLVNLQALISKSDVQHAKYILEVNERLNGLSGASKAAAHESQTGLAMMRKLRKQVSRSIQTTIAITADIRKILVLLRTLSKDVLAKVAANV